MANTDYVYQVCALGSPEAAAVCSADSAPISTVEAGAALWTSNGCSNGICHSGTVSGNQISDPLLFAPTITAQDILVAIETAPGIMPANTLPDDDQRRARVRAICEALEVSGSCVLPAP